MPKLTRRQVLQSAAALSGAALAAVPAPAESTPQRTNMPHSFRKAVLYPMLPAGTVNDQMKLVRDCGFEAVEAPPMGPQDIERLRAAAESADVRIHSIIYGGWDPPLSSPDAEAAARSLENARAAIRCAKNAGADDILLVPAVVDANTRYADAYKRSHKAVQELLPLAEDQKIRICLEEVWNNFLLSPLEFAAFVDSFHSPWVMSYFDVGNVVPFAWPQDWIRTLGHRIGKVHLKDFKGGPGLFGGIGGKFVNLGDGSIDWAQVKQAFAEVGYSGYVTTELASGDEAYLKDVRARIDRLLE